MERPVTTRRRWGDNDKTFGPFTYAKDAAWPHWAIILSSGDECHPSNSLRLSGFGRTFIAALPSMIQPWRKKVYPGVAWDAATVARLGRDWYYNTHRREFGLSLSNGGEVGGPNFLQVKYGAQTHDSSSDMSWSYFLPWTQWRHIRHSLYDLQGNFFADMPERRSMFETWAWRKALENACPAITFAFTDFDGEEIEAKCHIEEREWRRGDGWWKWLSVFYRPNIGRSLTFNFSKEVGDRKGSWKGGTIGGSIALKLDELHESAFRRYCNENELTFKCVVG